MHTLGNRLVVLGRMYSGTERYFPLRKSRALRSLQKVLLEILWLFGQTAPTRVVSFAAFLVRYLERWSCELQFDVTFVFKTLQDIGVTVSKLHEIYDRLFKTKVRIGRVWLIEAFFTQDTNIGRHSAAGSIPMETMSHCARGRPA